MLQNMFFHIKNVLIDAKSGTEITDIGRKNWCPLVKILDPPLRPLVNLLKLVNSLSWGSVSAAPQNNVCPPTTCKTRKEKKGRKKRKNCGPYALQALPCENESLQYNYSIMLDTCLTKGKN